MWVGHGLVTFNRSSKLLRGGEGSRTIDFEINLPSLSLRVSSKEGSIQFVYYTYVLLIYIYIYRTVLVITSNSQNQIYIYFPFDK